MEDQRLLLYTVLPILIVFTSLYIFQSLTKRHLKLPPAPPTKLPLLGHLYLLNPPIHRTFRSLASRLGPVFSLQLGSRLVYVVSSLPVAQECFTTNDIILANRPRLLLGKHVGYGWSTMAIAPYGNHWRNLRRIGAIEIFSAHRINSFLPTRRDEIRRLIFGLARISSKGFAGVNMRTMLSDLTFNNVMRMVAGKRYYGEDLEGSTEAANARELIASVVAEGGAGNPADYFSVFNWISGYEKRIKMLAKRLDAFLQGLVDEKREKEEKGNTMIDHLLRLKALEPEYYTDTIIKGLALIITLAASDTTAVTLEWAMASLLAHPDVLEKAQTEIGEQIGFDRIVDEPDLTNLPYLQMVMNETFRLHPAAPLLIPHMASEDCTIAGYDMPRNTTLLINVWAIHRDPKLWDEPETFKPERFEKEGEEAKLLIFGMGRRSCPGSGLAQRFVGLALASLIQCFEWRKEDNAPLDMSEGKGLTMPKAKALRALCKARPSATTILSEAF